MYGKVDPTVVEYKLQNTKIQNPQYFFDFGFVQVQNWRKRQKSHRILSFSPVLYCTKPKSKKYCGFWIFVFCNLYSTRTDLIAFSVYRRNRLLVYRLSCSSPTFGRTSIRLKFLSFWTVGRKYTQERTFVCHCSSLK